MKWKMKNKSLCVANEKSSWLIMIDLNVKSKSKQTKKTNNQAL